MDYSVEDWLVVLTFLGRLIFGLVKFYVLIIQTNQIPKSLDKTAKAIEQDGLRNTLSV